MNLHPQATEAGVGRKGEAWKWMQGRVRGGVRKPESRSWELIRKIGLIFSKLFRRIGRRRHPRGCSPKMALDLRELRSSVSERRTQAHGRGAESTRAWRARNSDRAREWGRGRRRRQK